MRNVRLLIADDNPQNLLFLSNSLSDDFCIVATVSDEKAMIAAAAALDPHIIITDMPTTIGLDVFRRLKALMPDVKIIVLTDDERPELAEAALAAGASAFLTKNGGPDLCGKIRAVVRDLMTHPKRLEGKVSVYGTDRTLVERGVA